MKLIEKLWVNERYFGVIQLKSVFFSFRIFVFFLNLYFLQKGAVKNLNNSRLYMEKNNDKAYIVMKKIYCDVIQKGKKVAKTVIQSF